MDFTGKETLSNKKRGNGKYFGEASPDIHLTYFFKSININYYSFSKH